jgi:hypothetical protein
LIYLNRPDALNALNNEIIGELTVALEDAQKDKDIAAIVLTGSGRAFAGRITSSRPQMCWDGCPKYPSFPETSIPFSPNSMFCNVLIGKTTLNGVGEGRGVIILCNYYHNATDVLKPLVTRLLLKVILGSIFSF